MNSDVIKYFRGLLKCDYDIFENKNTIEVLFSKSQSSKKLFELILFALDKEQLKYKIIKSNSKTLIFNLIFNDCLYKIIFKRSAIL